MRTPPIRCAGTKPQDRTTVTAFWSVADVTDGKIWFGRGNPCDSAQQEFRFPS